MDEKEENTYSSTIDSNRERLLQLLRAFEETAGLPVIIYVEGRTPERIYPEDDSRIHSAACLKIIERCRSEKAFCSETDDTARLAAVPIMDELGNMLGFILLDGTPSDCSAVHFDSAALLLRPLTDYIAREELVSVKALKYINDFYHLLYTCLDERPQLTADELLHTFFSGTNRSLIYEQFRDYVHMSVSQYINHVRICKAKDLLSYTSLPVYLISDRVGFTDYNYFARCFKKKTGQSPAGYRSTHKFFL